jgi:hypothetical protein
VQWLGTEHERRIATLHLQVLVSFTPLVKGAARAANVRQTLAGPSDADARSLSDSAEAASNEGSGQEDGFEENTARRQSHASASTSPQRLARAGERGVQRPRSAPALGHVGFDAGEVAGRGSREGFGSALDVQGMAIGDRPNGWGAGTQAAIKRNAAQLCPADEQPEHFDDEVAEARPSLEISVAPFTPDSVALQPAAFAGFGAACAEGIGQSPTAAFSAASSLLEEQQRLALQPVAALWQLPGSQQPPPAAAQNVMATGVPVVTLHTGTSPTSQSQMPADQQPGSKPYQAANGLMGAFGDAEHAAAKSGLQAELSALIERAERLRAAMAAAIGSSRAEAALRPVMAGLGAAQSTGALVPLGKDMITRSGQAAPNQARVVGLFAEERSSQALQQQGVTQGKGTRKAASPMKPAVVRAVSNAVDLAGPSRQRQAASMRVNQVSGQPKSTGPGQAVDKLSTAKQPSRIAGYCARAERGSSLRSAPGTEGSFQPGARGVDQSPVLGRVDHRSSMIAATDLTARPASGLATEHACRHCITHSFEVTVERVEGLHSTRLAELEWAHSRCYVSYQFPGENLCLPFTSVHPIFTILDACLHHPKAHLFPS